MTAVLKLSVEHHGPHPDLEPGTRALLNRIRFLAASCRASAKLDLFEACRLLDMQTDAADEACLITLIRVMGQALDARPVFHRPGEADLSFDEAWLLSTIEARMRDDEDSYAFLVTRRIARDKRRTFGMLIFALADRLNAPNGGDPRNISKVVGSQTYAVS